MMDRKSRRADRVVHSRVSVAPVTCIGLSVYNRLRTVTIDMPKQLLKSIGWYICPIFGHSLQRPALAMAGSSRGEPFNNFIPSFGGYRRDR
jgi:hypothetical protein